MFVQAIELRQSPKQTWAQVTIVGCGLIGSSFALALKRSKICERVLGWDSSPSVLEEAAALGVIDGVDHAFRVGDVSASDLIYLATPVLQVVRFLRERVSQTKSGAIITDTGSTKEIICRAANEYLPDNRHFVGGHPIAGSQLSGVEHARADLFTGTTYVLTTENSAPGTGPFNRVCETIEALGIRVKLMSAVEHDRVLAWVSHLPQLLASALATTVVEQDDATALLDLAGTGYHDMTRLAESPWPMWRDILVTNPTEIGTALELIVKKLNSARDELNQFGTGDDPQFDVLRKLFKDDRR